MMRPDHATAWWNRDAVGEEAVVAADGTSYLGIGTAAWRVSPAGDSDWVTPLPGPEQWTSAGPTHTRLALLADGTLWIGQGRFLIRVRAATGEQLDRVELADAVSSSLVVAPDGTVYVIAGQNRVVAIAGDAPLDPAAPWPVWRRDNRRTSSVLRP